MGSFFVCSFRCCCRFLVMRVAKGFIPCIRPVGLRSLAAELIVRGVKDVPPHGLAARE